MLLDEATQMDVQTQRLLTARERPARQAILYQSWDNLLFLHWRCSLADIKARIPPPLSVDLYHGDAYISIVAFCMNAVRPLGLPALPWLSYFYELKVRVYVRDQTGEPGVYFLSLDCNRAPAVWIARTLFKLPYQHAVMTFAKKRIDETQGFAHTMTCNRLGTEDTARYSWSCPTLLYLPKPGSLEFFLTERYNFFTVKNGALVRGQVHHSPYLVGTPEIAESSQMPLLWEQVPLPTRAADLALCSPGVQIKAYALTKIPTVESHLAEKCSGRQKR